MTDGVEVFFRQSEALEWRHHMSRKRGLNDTQSSNTLFVFGVERPSRGSSQPISDNADLRTFSWKLDNSGATKTKGDRYFIVGTVRAIWERIKAEEPLHRHYYELIEEGTPCHPYFDLECHERSAPPLNNIVSALRDAINCSGIFPMWGHDARRSIVSSQDLFVLQSLPIVKEKFSLHVIVRLPTSLTNGFHCVFPNNMELGLWIKSFICPYMRAALGVDLIDTSVYSRNRTFRSPWCCKKDKNSTLVPIYANVVQSNSTSLAEECAPTGLWDAYEVFHRGLITDQSDTILLPAHFTKHFSDTDSKKHPAEHRVYAPLRPKASFSKIIKPLSEDLLHSLGISSANVSLLPAGLAESVIDNVVSALQKGDHPKHLHSNCFHPELDRYILTCVDDFRSCIWNIQAFTVYYALKNSRYCINVGREHKSNGTYVSIHLIRRTMSQRCYDDACKTFRGPEVPIPHEIQGCIWYNLIDK